MKQAISGWILFLVPKNLLSRMVGRLVAIRWPRPLGPLAVQLFATYYKIDLNEAEFPRSHYKSIADLFSRRLKPEVRPVRTESLVVHPSDSALNIIHKIDEPALIQAKGKSYSIEEFVDDSRAFDKFKGGLALTYYLCPTDYHRVHCPVDGKVTKVTTIPGKLWPVNNWSVRTISKLFAVNERLVVWIDTSLGEVALVMVGATNVGKMSLSFDDEITSNLCCQKRKTKTYDSPVPIKKGDDVGVFHMGSTVIMLYPKAYDIEPLTIASGPVQMGQALMRPLSP